MLKSSSLCLYSSNLGTFWLKIEQFWPFEEISIFSYGGLLDTGRHWWTLWKGTTQGSFQQSLVEIGSVVSEEKIFFLISSPLFLFLAWWPSWSEGGITGHNFGRGPFKDHSTKVWLQLTQWFLRRRFVCEFPIRSYVKLSSAVGPSWSKGRTARHIFGREPSNEYFIKILFLLSKWIQTRFLWEFPIGSYVKLSSAVAAILVGGLKCQT